MPPKSLTSLSQHRRSTLWCVSRQVRGVRVKHGKGSGSGVRPIGVRSAGRGPTNDKASLVKPRCLQAISTMLHLDFTVQVAMGFGVRENHAPVQALQRASWLICGIDPHIVPKDAITMHHCLKA